MNEKDFQHKNKSVNALQSIHLHCYFIIIHYYMIANKALALQTTSHTLPNTSPLKNYSTPQHIQPKNDLGLIDDFHFDDSHFSSHCRALNNTNITCTQPITTFIRKISITQRCAWKRDCQNEAMDPRSKPQKNVTKYLNQSFLRAITPQISYSEGNQRNYTSCSIRRKKSSCSTYPSRTLLPATPPPEDLEKDRIEKYCSINPSAHQKYLHKRKQEQSHRHKRFNSLDYNIIKPSEIQAALLSCRQELKDCDKNESPQQLALFRKKREQWKRQWKEQAQRRQQHMKRHQQSNRRKAHTSSLNRRNAAMAEERNELLPWEVDFNLVDII